MGIGYLTIGTSDPEKSKAFYEQIFPMMGGKMISKLQRGYLYSPTSERGVNIMVVRPYDTSKPASGGNGPMIAIKVPTRALADQVYAKAISLGAKDEGKPGVRGAEGPKAFYGAYFRDFDGNKYVIFRTGGPDAKI